MHVSAREHPGGRRRAWLPARERSQPLLAAAGALLAVGALLALVGFSRSERTTKTVTVPVRHDAAFGYSATVPADSVYAATSVSTGQPVFTQYVDVLTVQFTDKLSAPLHGTASLDARLTEVSTGWSRTIPVVAPTPVSGPSITLSGPLSLASLQALEAGYQLQLQTRSTSFRVTLLARVTLTGQQAGIPVSTVFAPRISLKLDATALSPPAPPNGKTNVANADPRVDPFAVSRSEDARGPQPVARELSLGLVSVPVDRIRLAAVLALIAGLVAGLPGLLVRLLSEREDEVTGIRRRYGDLLVPSLTQPSTTTTVQIATFEDLATLARRLESAIVHAPSGSGHTFSVYDGPVTYRYQLGAAKVNGLVVTNGAARPSDHGGEARGPSR